MRPVLTQHGARVLRFTMIDKSIHYPYATDDQVATNIEVVEGVPKSLALAAMPFVSFSNREVAIHKAMDVLDEESGIQDIFRDEDEMLDFAKSTLERVRELTGLDIALEEYVYELAGPPVGAPLWINVAVPDPLDTVLRIRSDMLAKGSKPENVEALLHAISFGPEVVVI